MEPVPHIQHCLNPWQHVVRSRYVDTAESTAVYTFETAAVLISLLGGVGGFVTPPPAVAARGFSAGGAWARLRHAGEGWMRRGAGSTKARLPTPPQRHAQPRELENSDGVPSRLPPGAGVDVQPAATAGTRLPSSSSSSSSTRHEFLQAGGALASAGMLVALGLSSGTALGGAGQGIQTAWAAEAATAAADGSAALLQKEVLSYIREALPEWRPLPDQDIQLKQITGGITNVIFKARNAGTGGGALVRVYGKDTDLLLDRRKEAAVFSELSTLGFGPKMLGAFKGGRIEELLDARAATPGELLQTSPFDVPGAIAAQLASLHQQRVKSSAGAPDRPVMWTSIDRWLKTAAGLDVAKKFPLDRVAEEVAWLKRNLPDPAAATGATAVSPDQKLAAEIADGVVFAHNDLLSGNVLVGPRSAKTISTLRLIDFEYSDYNPCGYDIANHFCECAGFDADFRRKYPTERQRKRFLTAYVEAARPEVLRDALSGDNLIGELARRVDRYALASHLTWALWAVIQANTSEIEGFNFAGYALKRLDGYAFHKAKFYG